MNKVFVVGGDGLIEQMFKRFGWKIVPSIADADLVQFTGGSDVSPIYYNQRAYYTTGCMPDRDRREVLIFEHTIKLGKKMAGICRGGQFLNIMCGGSMWQDVNNHAIAGGHIAQDTLTGECFTVTSTHHQMMVPGEEAQVFLIAQETSYRIAMSSVHEKASTIKRFVSPFGKDDPDIEGVTYLERGVLCFQPHPEYSSVAGLDQRYFDYLEEFFDFKSVNQEK